MAKPVNGIFISYRREDSAGHAGRLFDRLAAHFGRGSVFMDVEGIEAGVDFVETIERAVGGCAVLLAVIGRGWLDSKDSQGRRRLDDPQDFIRLETSSALARKVRVIPVLVEGARIPRAEELPEDLRTITRRQALELRDSRWEDDIQALIGVLERVLASSDTPEAGRPGASQDDRRDVPAWAWKAGAAALLLGGVLLGFTLISHPWRPQERVALPQPSMTQQMPKEEIRPTTQAPTVTDVQPAVPAAPAPELPEKVVRQTVPKTAPSPAALQKPVAAKPAARAAPEQVAAVQPVPVPPAPPRAQPQPAPALAKVPPVAEPAPPRKVAVIALGEPTFRDFWEGERKAAYSAKIAGLYRDALREAASGRVELSINSDIARDLRGLDKALRESPGLCDATRAGTVFVARVEETQTFSRVESAYWPELRLTAIACDSGKQYTVRDTLSPRRDDGFPFEGGMAETMEKFAREYRHLLQ